MIANIITAIRCIVAPLFAVAIVTSFHSAHPILWQYVALAALSCVELSDALDGPYARKFGKVSDFGKVFDPTADSLSRLTVFLGFLIAGIMPLWMFLIFLYRDIFVNGIRVLAIRQGVVVSARKSGKLKAILQAIGSFGTLGVCILNSYGISLIPSLVLGRHPGYYIMLIPALFTAYSAIDYAFGNKSIMARSLRPDVAG